MSIEEWVKQSRDEHRQRFGSVGLKKDCEHYGMKKGEHHCKACISVRYFNCLQCEYGVCRFYSPKEMEEDNEHS